MVDPLAQQCVDQLELRLGVLVQRVDVGDGLVVAPVLPQEPAPVLAPELLLAGADGAPVLALLVARAPKDLEELVPEGKELRVNNLAFGECQQQLANLLIRSLSSR